MFLISVCNAHFDWFIQLSAQIIMLDTSCSLSHASKKSDMSSSSTVGFSSKHWSCRYSSNDLCMSHYLYKLSLHVVKSWVSVLVCIVLDLEAENSAWSHVVYFHSVSISVRIIPEISLAIFFFCALVTRTIIVSVYLVRDVSLLI